MEDPFADLRGEKPQKAELPYAAKTARLAGMRPEFMEPFAQMAQEYYQRTGQVLNIDDAFRTAAAQAEAHRLKPNLAAAPGHSQHELGMAMDLNTEQANKLHQLGLLQKYGFYRPMMTQSPGHKFEPWHIQLARNFEREAETRGASAQNNFQDPFADLRGVKGPPPAGKELTNDPFADLRAAPKPQPKPLSAVYEGKIEKPVPPVWTPENAVTAAMPEAQFYKETGEMVGKALDLPHEYISKPIGEAVAKHVPDVEVQSMPFPEAQWTNQDLEMPQVPVNLRETAKDVLPFMLDFPVYGAVGKVAGAGLRAIGPKASALPRAEKILQTASEAMGQSKPEINKIVQRAKKLTETTTLPGPTVLHGGGPETAPWMKQAAANIKKSTKQFGRDVVEATKAVREDLGITGDERAKMIIEEKMGLRRDAHQRAIASLQGWQDTLEKMPETEQMLQAAKYMEGGVGAVNEELKPLFSTIKELNEQRYNDVNAVGGRHLTHRENYIRGGVYSNPNDPIIKENLTKYRAGEPFDNHLDLDPTGRPYKAVATFDESGNVTEVKRIGGVGEVPAEGTETAPYRMPHGKTLTGGRAYFKGKKFDTWAEPLMVGYKPKHGLMDLMLFDLGQKDHYIYGMRAWNQARKEGFIKFYNPGRQPEGFVPINDPMGRINIPYLASKEAPTPGIGRVPGFEPGMPSDVVPAVSTMQAYAPRPFAKIFNNYLSEGLRGHPAYDRIRAVTDASRKFGVSFSPFHAKVTFNTDVSYGIGEHGSKAIGAMLTGDAATAAKEVGKLAKAVTPAKTIQGLLNSSKVTRAYYNNELTGKVAQGVQEYIRVGGTMPTADTINGLAVSLSRAMKQVGKEAGNAHMLRAIDKTADLTSVPIMKYMVPYAKLESFLMKRERMYPEWLAQWKGKTNTNAAKIDWQQRLRSIRRFDDAVYGQLSYDNLHLSNFWKDAMFFLIKYPGWNLGSGRWLTANIKGAYQGVRSALGGAPMGDFQKQALKFTAGLMAKTTLYGTLVYGLIHGKWPTDYRELITKGIWTGGYNRDGSKQYIRDADYMRDLLGAYNEPLTTLQHKMPSMVGLPWHLLANEDYFGGKIMTPWSQGGMEAVKRWPKELAQAVGKEFVPYSAQQLFKGKSPWARYGQLAGYTLTPGSLSRTPLEDIIYHHYSSRAPRGETPEKREQYESRMSVEDLGREGKKEEFEAELKRLKGEKQITKTQEKNIRQRVKDVRAFRFAHLPIEVAVQAWEAGTDEEKAFYAPVLKRKINNLFDRDFKKYRELKHYKKELGKYKKKPEYELEKTGLPAPWETPGE